MWQLLLLAVLQSILLSAGQVFLKFALNEMGTPSWRWSFIAAQVTNWWFLATGVCLIASSVLWMYILKKYPFSMAYPLASMSYVFGMLAAIFIFHEDVPLTRWLGVVLIMGGCYFIAK
ncbi:MAG: EamA family transporter [Bacteroidales bacterium]|nr:EamA family transporter [Bacteroidales bacterium]